MPLAEHRGGVPAFAHNNEGLNREAAPYEVLGLIAGANCKAHIEHLAGPTSILTSASLNLRMVVDTAGGGRW